MSLRRSYKNKRLARRLMIYVVLFSTLITIFTSAIQLYNSFNRDVNTIESRLDEIEVIYMDSLANSIWTADIKAIKTILNGIFRLPDMQYIEVWEDAKPVARLGAPGRANIIIREYPVNYIYNNQEQKIGQLVVQASLRSAYQHVWDQVVVILISNGFKTFLVTGFILYLFYILVTRHPETMARYARDLDLSRPAQHLELHRKPNLLGFEDELDDVVSAIHEMRENLANSFNQLKDSEEHYKNLVETTTAIPWEMALNPDRFTYVGPQAEKLLGYPVSEWYNPNFWETHVLEEDLKPVSALSRHMIDDGLSHTLEYRMRKANGEIVWVKDFIKVHVEYHKPVKLSGFIFDISREKAEQQELELYRTELEKLVEERTTELQNSNNELEAFCYSVSHDLRAPLRSINGFSLALLEDYREQLDEEGRHYIDRICYNTEHMGDLIEDLLKLSRITRHELKIENVNISELAEEVFQRLHEQYPERDVSWQVEPGLVVKGDKSLLKILLDNLVGNAWKYTQGQQQARIEIGQGTDDENDFIYIKDNGIGFDMRYYDKIFKVFQRLHSDEAFPGNGIGLSTVQRIIHRHQGKVWAESIPERETTFYFKLGLPNGASAVIQG